MQLRGITMMRNEGDIVESFVRHHLRFLDGLAIIVHSPTDGTREILDALHREGLPIDLFPLEDLGFYQGQRVTRVARTVFDRHKPDFLFSLDADEFICVDSRQDLEATLARVPWGVHGLLPWHTYVPSKSDELAESDPVNRIRRRTSVDSSQSKYFKVVVGGVFASDPTLVIAHGNHGLASADPARDQALQYRRLDQLTLAHFPVRSADQIVTKTLIGWLSHIVIGEHQTGRSGHWRGLYSRLKTNPRLDMDALTELALEYANNFDSAGKLDATGLIDDPLPVKYTLRYSHLRLGEPLAHLVGFTERVAHAYWGLIQQPRAPS